MSSEVIEMKYDVVRTLFPAIPSEVSRKPYLATHAQQEFVDAGLERYLTRTVTLTGVRRQIQFPVKLQLLLNHSPTLVSS